jgi:type II secretory pathway component PulF
LNNVVSRRAVRPLLLGHTFRLLSAMLQSKVPLLDAIKLCEKSVANIYYRELFQRLAQEVEVGHKIADTLSATPFIPPSAAQMVQTAERSGKLGEILETVGLFYEEEGERQLQKMVKLLEPVIVVFMGSIVATVVASVVLPLLDVSTVSS